MSVAVDVTDMRSDTSRHSTVWLCIVAVGRKSQKHLSTFYVGQSFVRLSLKLTHFFFLLRGELEADRKQEQKKMKLQNERRNEKKNSFCRHHCSLRRSKSAQAQTNLSRTSFRSFGAHTETDANERQTTETCHLVEGGELHVDWRHATVSVYVRYWANMTHLGNYNGKLSMSLSVYV